MYINDTIVCNKQLVNFGIIPSKTSCMMSGGKQVIGLNDDNVERTDCSFTPYKDLSLDTFSMCVT
jgi:hypothetical protein